VTQVRHARRADSLSLLRVSLTALTALGIVGTAFELATLHHWNGAMQLVPWVALAVLAAALVLHAGPSGRPPRTRLVRVLALLVLASSLFGILEHALVNYRSGPLNERFADTWTTLSPWLRWWYAITRTVGPAPTLAAGMLGQAAATLILATIGQRATTTMAPARPARRHRLYPHSIHRPEMAYGRPDTVATAPDRPWHPTARRLSAGNPLAAGSARSSPGRVGGRAPSRHRRRRW
jgi:hypothetical protein